MPNQALLVLADRYYSPFFIIEIHELFTPWTM